MFANEIFCEKLKSNNTFKINKNLFKSLFLEKQLKNKKEVEFKSHVFKNLIVNFSNSFIHKFLIIVRDRPYCTTII